MTNYLDKTLPLEEQYLSPYATKSASSKGQQKQISSDNLRIDFARGKWRLIFLFNFIVDKNIKM